MGLSCHGSICVNDENLIPTFVLSGMNSETRELYSSVWRIPANTITRNIKPIRLWEWRRHCLLVSCCEIPWEGAGAGKLCLFGSLHHLEIVFKMILHLSDVIISKSEKGHQNISDHTLSVGVAGWWSWPHKTEGFLALLAEVTPFWPNTSFLKSQTWTGEQEKKGNRLLICSWRIWWFMSHGLWHMLFPLLDGTFLPQVSYCAADL